MTCLLISDFLPTFDCSCMVENIKLFCTSKSQNKNNSVFPTMQIQSKVGKFSEINKQVHVKSWLTYLSYSSFWWILSCTRKNIMKKVLQQQISRLSIVSRLLPFEVLVVADLSNPCCSDKMISSIFFGVSRFFGVSSILLNPDPKVHRASKLFW